MSDNDDDDKGSYSTLQKAAFLWFSGLETDHGDRWRQVAHLAANCYTQMTHLHAIEKRKRKPLSPQTKERQCRFPFRPPRLALLLFMCFDYRHMPPTIANRKQQKTQPRYPHSNKAVIRTPALVEKPEEKNRGQSVLSKTVVIETVYTSPLCETVSDPQRMSILSARDTL
ncbi:hypothetical protein Baya_7234 [Bagarius yarrelli]|uniref:Uncharacterized protein n=1 Tax=Bagarius yarrelli TaxID=175774 RepID=A0A556TZN5_BAGYA|nr:hypothetical protein Baya_7234 [Bagarius yarrelli]